MKYQKYQRGEISQFLPDSDLGFIQPARGGPEIKFKASRIRPPFDRKSLKVGQQVLFSTKTNNSAKAESVRLLSPSVLESLATGQAIQGRVWEWADGSPHGYLTPLDKLGTVFAHVDSVASQYPLKPGQLVFFRVIEKAHSILAVNVVPVEAWEASS